MAIFLFLIGLFMFMGAFGEGIQQTAGLLIMLLVLWMDDD